MHGRPSMRLVDGQGGLHLPNVVPSDVQHTLRHPRHVNA